MGFQPEVSCRVASQLLRPRPLAPPCAKKTNYKTNSGPSHHNTYFMLLLRQKTITTTTLTHNSTSKQKEQTKIKTDGIIVALYSGPHNPTAGKKKKEESEIRLR